MSIVGDFRGQSIRSIYPASGPSQLPPLIVPKTLFEDLTFSPLRPPRSKKATKQRTKQHLKTFMILVDMVSFVPQKKMMFQLGTGDQDGWVSIGIQECRARYTIHNEVCLPKPKCLKSNQSFESLLCMCPLVSVANYCFSTELLSLKFSQF